MKDKRVHPEVDQLQWLFGYSQQVVLDGQASDLVPVLSSVNPIIWSYSTDSYSILYK